MNRAERCWPALTALGLALVLGGSTCMRGRPVRTDDPVLIRMDDRTVRASQFDRYLRANSTGEVLNRAARERLFRQFLEEELLLAEADRRGIAALEPGEERRAARTRRIKELFNQEVLQELSVNEAEIERYYHDHPDQFRLEEQIRVREILLANRADAEALVRRLRRRPNRFVEEARQYSQRPEEERGRLLTFAKGELPQEFERVLFALPTGSVSDVIETNYGSYVIFKVEAHELSSLAPLDKVRNQVQLRLLQESSDRLQQAFMRRAAQQRRVEVLVYNLPFRPQNHDFLGKEVTSP